MSDAAILDTFAAVFERLTVDRDAAAATAHFAADDDVWMSGSAPEELAVGPEAVAELHRTIARSPLTLAFEWDRRIVHREGDVAWVNAAGSMRLEAAGGEPATLPYRVTAVFVRRGGAWRWHTFHGSAPKDD